MYLNKSYNNVAIPLYCRRICQSAWLTKSTCMHGIPHFRLYTHIYIHAIVRSTEVILWWTSHPFGVDGYWICLTVMISGHEFWEEFEPTTLRDCVESWAARNHFVYEIQIFSIYLKWILSNNTYHSFWLRLTIDNHHCLLYTRLILLY